MLAEKIVQQTIRATLSPQNQKASRLTTARRLNRLPAGSTQRRYPCCAARLLGGNPFPEQPQSVRGRRPATTGLTRSPELGALNPGLVPSNEGLKLSHGVTPTPPEPLTPSQ